jgi:solute carrier family 25 uncoupling protein 8/9
MGGQKTYNFPLPVHMLCGGFAGSIAEIASLPLDTTKVRLQLQGNQIKQGILKEVKYKNMMQGMMTIAAEEGPFALWKGMMPGL